MSNFNSTLTALCIVQQCLFNALARVCIAVLGCLCLQSIDRIDPIPKYIACNACSKIPSRNVSICKEIYCLWRIVDQKKQINRKRSQKRMKIKCPIDAALQSQRQQASSNKTIQTRKSCENIFHQFLAKLIAKKALLNLHGEYFIQLL